MIFNLAEQIAQLSSGMTLHPGDLILTGTPAGVGVGRGEFLKAGDMVKLWIEKIGDHQQQDGLMMRFLARSGHRVEVLNAGEAYPRPHACCWLLSSKCHIEVAVTDARLQVPRRSAGALRSKRKISNVESPRRRRRHGRTIRR